MFWNIIIDICLYPLPLFLFLFVLTALIRTSFWLPIISTSLSKTSSSSISSSLTSSSFIYSTSSSLPLLLFLMSFMSLYIDILISSITSSIIVHDTICCFSHPIFTVNDRAFVYTGRYEFFLVISLPLFFSYFRLGHCDNTW